MRILLLPHNIASQISETIVGLRHHQVEAIGLVAQSKLQAMRHVSSLPSAYTGRFPQRYIRALPAVAQIFRAIKWADVIHWHFEWAVPGALDVIFAKLLRKKIVVEFHGSDIRKSDIEATGNPYYAKLCHLHPELCDPNKNSIKRQKIFARANASVIVPYPAMLAHLSPGFFNKRYCVLHRIDLNRFTPEFPRFEQTFPNIVHIPSRPLLKGSHYVNEAIANLKNQFVFQYSMNSDISNEVALNLIQKSDIFLDQFVLGSYGVASIEAMAFGKPVVCYIKSEFKRHYPSDLPIICATAEELTRVLQLLIENPLLRHNIGKASRNYAEKYHDTRKIALELLKIYQEL